ncbi:MAG: sugar ABC transporter permease [Candidatus Omnitrophota bacterium]
MRARAKEAMWAYIFLLPNLVGFLIFTLFPIVASLVLSFVEWNMTPPITAARFIGFKNFTMLMKDPYFWKYFGNTIYFMMAIPIGIMGSLLIAVLLNRKLKGIVFFRTVYFLPTISAGVAICLLWMWIFNTDYGLLNMIIASMGKFFGLKLQSLHWLTSEAWAKPALMIMGLWATLGGYNMILYLAALQGISKDFYEAADIDGANSWQKFWAITWPMISPTTFFIFIMSIIGGFQGGFMAARIMTGGGPNGATKTLEYYIFDKLYSYQHFGYASSIAWFLFVVIFIVTLFNWRYGGKLVHY